MEADGARLLRMGSNAVYRLTAPVIVRISRAGADIEHARRTVAVARWLESVNYPAVRVLDVDQPVVLDGHAITFWEKACGRRSQPEYAYGCDPRCGPWHPAYRRVRWLTGRRE